MNTEIQKQFVSFEIAVRLKALGFNEPCFGFFTGNNEEIDLSTDSLFTNKTLSRIHKIRGEEDGFERFQITAPLFQQSIDYIRLNHNIDVVFVPPIAWQVQTYDKNMTVYNFNLPEAKTIQEDEIEYHKAKEQAILKAIELIEKTK
jgi:hypothetical protein